MSGAATDESTVVSDRFAVGGLGLTDLSALVGALVWLVAVVTTDLGPVERALALAPLVLVPLGMGMAATPSLEGTTGRLYHAAVVAQPLGAVFFVLSFVLPSGGMWPAVAATPWVFVTGLLGLTALTRMRRRGPWPLAETLLDAGFTYSVVGAVALILFHLDVTFWFDPVIILLTAVHFHFAGFALPVFTGLAGRTMTDRPATGFRVLASVVLFGPAVIAIGISFSPLVEVLAVGGFTLTVAALGGYVAVRVAPNRPCVQGLLITLSVLSLPLSMVLALGYGIATFIGTDPFGLDISTMISLHGSLNAYGFALVGVVGWRLAVPRADT